MDRNDKGYYFKKGRTLKQVLNNKGYYYLNLCKDGKPKTFLVHRLIAKTFLSNPKNKPHINHLDANPKNNNIKNLEWCTHQENMQHAWDNNLIKTRKSVKQFDKSGNFLNEFVSVSEAARQSGLQATRISAVCLGRRKTTGGYIWKHSKLV